MSAFKARKRALDMARAEQVVGYVIAGSSAAGVVYAAIMGGLTL